MQHCLKGRRFDISLFLKWWPSRKIAEKHFGGSCTHRPILAVRKIFLFLLQGVEDRKVRVSSKWGLSKNKLCGATLHTYYLQCFQGPKSRWHCHPRSSEKNLRLKRPEHRRPGLVVSRVSSIPTIARPKLLFLRGENMFSSSFLVLMLDQPIRAQKLCCQRAKHLWLSMRGCQELLFISQERFSKYIHSLENCSL